MIAAEPVVQVAVAMATALNVPALPAAVEASRRHVAASGRRANLFAVRQTPEHRVVAIPFVPAA